MITASVLTLIYLACLGWCIDAEPVHLPMMLHKPRKSVGKS